MRLPAYAKINLTLEVLGRRGDGFHEVVSILQTVDLADRVDLQPGSSLRVVCDAPELDGEANLAWRAAEALARRAGIQPRARVFIRKRIPVGMGLGGGSSDAAAVLMGLNRMWELGFGLDELSEIAAGLGSDVPFFLRGGIALAEGRGEVVTPLPQLAPFPALLVCPGDSIPDKTRRLYGRIRPPHYSDGGITQRVVRTMLGGQLEADTLHNVFESVALETFPGLGDVYRTVTEVMGRLAAPFRRWPGPFLPAGQRKPTPGCGESVAKFPRQGVPGTCYNPSASLGRVARGMGTKTQGKQAWN